VLIIGGVLLLGGLVGAALTSLSNSSRQANSLGSADNGIGAASEQRSVAMATNEAVVEGTAAVATESPALQTPQPVATASKAPSSGTKLVPSEMPPGTYRSTNPATTSCYWQRLSGLGGTFGEIIANENASGPAVVLIEPSDKAFSWRLCAPWSNDLGPITSSPDAPFGSGTFVVGVDIAPGTWRAEGTSNCYWERLSGFSGSFNDIIANDNTQGSTIVQISPADTGFRSSRCGTWTKVEAAGPAAATSAVGIVPVPTIAQGGTPANVVVNKKFGAAVRAQPSSDAAIITNLGCGQVLQVLNTGSGGWFQVQSGTNQGWIGGARVVPGTSPAGGACSGAPSPPFAMGQIVRALVQTGCLSIRPSAAGDAPISDCVPTGHAFILTNGPVEVAGEDWFAVRSTTTGLAGWTRAAYLQR
jgi:hypothetical protein